jgi:hypothetical protein
MTEIAAYTALNKNIYPGFPNFYVKIGNKNVYNPPVIQLHKAAYGTTLGLTI